MTKSTVRRIKILSDAEINELYGLPSFNHADREDFFSLDDETQTLVDECRRLETKCYFILLLGYFRSKPIIFNFNFSEVQQDLEYIEKKYFNGRKVTVPDLSPTTKTKLSSRLLRYTGYQLYQNKQHKASLLDQLRDVATISIEPRYVFDECIAYFGKQKIALAGYTTIQDHITSVLSQERTRIKDVLNKSLPPSTRATLLKLLELDDTFTDLAKLKKMSKDFSVNQIKKELKTHRKIKAIYSELKVVVNQLELSPKNLEYYASLVRHKSSFRLRRHADEQSILYLVCYLFFRYRETNDNLVSAFSYLVRKLSESSKSYGKHKVADDLEIVRNNLKVAGNLLSFFIESEISDDMAFGDIRKKAFKLLSKDKIRLLSSHLDNNDFDTRQYEWEYIDRQTSK